MAEYRTKHVPNHPKASSSGCVYEHVLIAEKALGHYLPDGVEIHHVDENTRNNSGSNLVICQDKRYHKLLHVRAHVLKLGGNPATQRYCAGCDSLRLMDEFNRAKANKNDGIQKYCRDCQSRYYKGYKKIPLPNEVAF